MQSRLLTCLLTALWIQFSVAIDGAQGGLVFRPDLAHSSVTYIHDVINDGAAADRTLTVPVSAGFPGFDLPDLTLSNGNVQSRAQAGLGHNANPFRGTGVVQPETVLTQEDTLDETGNSSTLRINFNLRWDVVSRFGPPILSSFSVPLYGDIGAGGEVKAEMQVDWGRVPANDDGSNFTPMRDQFTTTKTFNEGTHLTALSADSRPFNPTSLGDTDDYVVRGFIEINAKNATEPTAFSLDPGSAVVQYRFEDRKKDGTMLNQARNSSQISRDIRSSRVRHSRFASLYNGPVTLGPGGISGLAARFAGNGVVSSPEIGAPIRPAIPMTDSFSVELWARSATTDWNTTGWLASARSPNGFLLSPVAGTKRVNAIILDDAGTPQNVAGFDATNITDLHHYVLTHEHDSTTDQGLTRLFFDGDQVANGNFIGSRDPFARIKLNIGADEVGPGNFNFGMGLIDEFALYPFQLDPRLIKARYKIARFEQFNDVNIDIPGFADSFDFVENLVRGIPEPATALLLGSSMLFTLVRRRRVLNRRA